MMRPRKCLNESAIVAAVLALLGTLAFRLPELLNPGVVNSDSAVVGLQAMHLLRGEWHWFLWGSGYQTTADSVVAAGLFLIFGATPLALMMTALLGHLLATLFTLLTLCRRFSPPIALLLVTPLIASPAPTHTYTLHPPRQTALTLVLAALWLLDGATRAKRETLHFGLGAAIGAFACFADPYALVFTPGLALLAWMSGFDGGVPRVHLWRRMIAAGVGAVVGAIPLVILRLTPQASHGQLMLSQSRLARNWALLLDPCLPWSLGTQVLHQPVGARDYVLWRPPWAFHLVQWLGASIFAVAFFTALSCIADRKRSWEIRRLGLAAAVTVLVTLGGFLFSVMPIDLYASRYLTSLILVAPLLLAVVADAVRPLRLLAIVAPMIASFAVSGWLGYEPFVQGLRILDAGLERDEAVLLRELERRKIAYATADYWASYRLTFMFQERVTVVPIHEEQDRYAPYRRAFFQTSRYAYIFDHRRSEESRETVEKRVNSGREERFSVGGFDVYLLSKPAGAPIEWMQIKG
jgi:hypothetical protein